VSCRPGGCPIPRGWRRGRQLSHAKEQAVEANYVHGIAVIVWFSGNAGWIGCFSMAVVAFPLRSCKRRGLTQKRDQRFRRGCAMPKQFSSDVQDNQDRLSQVFDGGIGAAAASAVRDPRSTWRSPAFNSTSAVVRMSIKFWLFSALRFTASVEEGSAWLALDDLGRQGGPPTWPISAII
jgi:hypothetical protein